MPINGRLKIGREGLAIGYQKIGLIKHRISYFPVTYEHVSEGEKKAALPGLTVSFGTSGGPLYNGGSAGHHAWKLLPFFGRMGVLPEAISHDHSTSSRRETPLREL